MYIENSFGKFQIGDFIKKKLKETGTSIRSFSKKSGVNTQALYQVINDTGNPTKETYNKVFTALGLKWGLVVTPLNICYKSGKPCEHDCNGLCRDS